MQIYLYSVQTTDPKQIDDSTGGKGGMVTYTLKNLESSASYAIYMIAKNSKGTTSKSNSISFTTPGMCIMSNIARQCLAVEFTFCQNKFP